MEKEMIGGCSQHGEAARAVQRRDSVRIKLQGQPVKN
jgi:hypothetical protein